MFCQKIHSSFITKHASLVQNRPQNRAYVNAPLTATTSIALLFKTVPSKGFKIFLIERTMNQPKPDLF
jgi:hypothetical protein